MFKNFLSKLSILSNPLDVVVFTDLLDENARLIFKSAYEIAQFNNHCSLTPEHILISFAKSDPILFQLLTESLNLDPDLITYEISTQLNQIGKRHDGSLLDDTRQVMSYALKHAQGREDAKGRIGTEDLIIGIFEDKGGFSTKLFKRLGVEEGEPAKQFERLMKKERG